MDSLLTELLAVLEQQNAILADLLTAAQKHNTVMLKNDTSGIMAAVMQLEELSQDLRKQDQQREFIQQRLADVLGLERQVIFSDIMASAEKSQLALGLMKLAEEIRENMNKLGEINKLNHVLAARGLQFTSQILNIIMPNESNT